MHDCKIWKLFWTCGNRQKKTKCDQFFLPTSDFSDFCNPYFIYHTLFDGMSCWRSICRNVGLQVVLKNIYRSAGGQCSHCNMGPSPVSWCNCTLKVSINSKIELWKVHMTYLCKHPGVPILPNIETFFLSSMTSSFKHDLLVLLIVK